MQKWQGLLEKSSVFSEQKVVPASFEGPVSLSAVKSWFSEYLGKKTKNTLRSRFYFLPDKHLLSVTWEEPSVSWMAVFCLRESGAEGSSTAIEQSLDSRWKGESTNCCYCVTPARAVSDNGAWVCYFVLPSDHRTWPYSGGLSVYVSHTGSRHSLTASPHFLGAAAGRFPPAQQF